jgi:hypothetical protein
MHRVRRNITLAKNEESMQFRPSQTTKATMPWEKHKNIYSFKTLIYAKLALIPRFLKPCLPLVHCLGALLC